MATFMVVALSDSDPSCVIVRSIDDGSDVSAVDGSPPCCTGAWVVISAGEAAVGGGRTDLVVSPLPAKDDDGTARGAGDAAPAESVVVTGEGPEEGDAVGMSDVDAGADTTPPPSDPHTVPERTSVATTRVSAPPHLLMTPRGGA